MNKLSVLTGFLVIILSLALKAQQPQGIPDINTATIPSPDAVTFDKLITQQVDLYTGKPNVEIPLFIAKSRKLTLPIKLVYNNSGLVVTDHSSWAGYGWSLIAGGQVSRQVRGLKDETPDIGYFALAHYLPSDPLQLNKNPNYFTAGQQRRIANQTWDLEPDIYNYSFQGYSGQFIIYVDSLGNKTIYTIPYQNLKIVMDPDLSNSTIKGFTITSEDGTKYSFGENTQSMEHQYDNGSGDDNGWLRSVDFISGWVLTSIVSADCGDTISFNYQCDEEHFGFASTQSQSVALDFGACSQTCGLPTYFRTYYNSDEIIQSPKLHSITTANEQYVFTASSNSRLDLAGGKILSSIVQLYHSSVLRKYMFYTSYSGPDLTSFNGCRLFLDSIAEFNSQNINEKPPYRLHYKDRYRVPSTTSYSQDHWGYFNGRTNPSLVPTMDFNCGMHVGDADRSTDTIYAGTGILQQIDFPTGGYTKINYEPNTYGYETGYYPVIHYVINSNHCTVNADTCQLGDTKNSYDSSSFRINYNQYVHLEQYLEYCGGQEFVGLMQILDSLHNQIWFRNVQYHHDNPTHLLDDSLFLTKGHYFVDVRVGFQNFAWLTVSYKNIEEKADTLYYNKYLYCGGVRTRSIITNDGIDPSKEIWKTYNYDDLHDMGRSSGRLLADIPRYDRYQLLSCCSGMSESCTGAYLTVSANPCNLLSYFSGDIVCYTTVTESLGKNGEFGHNIYYFSYVNDIPTLNYPQAPPTSRRWRRGILHEKDSYDSIGNLKYKELYSEKFPSDDNNDPHFKKIIGVKGAWLNFGSCIEELNTVKIQPYEIRTEWHHPNVKTSVTFGATTRESLSIYEKYFYENPNHVQRTKIITNKSNGDSLITTYVYPKDIALTNINWGDQFSQAIYWMVNDLHIENAVLEQTDFINKENSIYLLGSKATFYKPYQIGYTYKMLPTKEYLLRLESPVAGSGFSRIHSNNDNKIIVDEKYDHAPEIVYEKYDVYGNIIQYKPRTSPRVSFLFGYNGALPLAKVINATTNDINYDPASGVISAPDSSFLTKYMFHPIYGMISETDPNGISTYYEYDHSGRLKFIKDTNGNILKRFLYHYAQ